MMITKLNKQTKKQNTIKHQEREDGEKFSTQKRKRNLKQTTEEEMPEGLALQRVGHHLLSFQCSSSVLTKKQDRPLPFLPSGPRRPTFVFYSFFSEGFSVCLGFCFLL